MSSVSPMRRTNGNSVGTETERIAKTGRARRRFSHDAPSRREGGEKGGGAGDGAHDEGPRPGLVGWGAGPDAARLSLTLWPDASVKPCARGYSAMRIIIAATSPRVQPACGSRATPPLPVRTPSATAHSTAPAA